MKINYTIAIGVALICTTLSYSKSFASDESRRLLLNPNIGITMGDEEAEKNMFAASDLRKKLSKAVFEKYIDLYHNGDANKKLEPRDGGLYSGSCLLKMDSVFAAEAFGKSLSMDEIVCLVYDDESTHYLAVSADSTSDNVILVSHRMYSTLGLMTSPILGSN